MTPERPRVLILACGNTLRSDDGIGPWLAAWAEGRFARDSRVRVISRQQWTPDLAEDIANALSVLFIDCSIGSDPGAVRLTDVHPERDTEGLATHHQSPSQLLALTRDLFEATPRAAKLLTIGAGSTELGEVFTDVVRATIPHACGILESTILEWLGQRSAQ
jgi:hydrogenase maturation protease